MKPNCYECKHRRSLPYDAHSRCAHPANDDIFESIELLVAMISGKLSGATELSALNVRGDPHGIKNGWFAWPFNFDPIWLLECDGFEKMGVKGNGSGISLPAEIEVKMFDEAEMNESDEEYKARHKSAKASDYRQLKMF